MRSFIFVIIVVGFWACFVSCQGRNKNQGLRNLILNEQELKFAGAALRTVLSSNANSYRRNRGTRRFTGTFTIIEKDPCGGLDIRIDADVDMINSNVYRRDYYQSAKDDATHISGNSNRGYAGQFNY